MSNRPTRPVGVPLSMGDWQEFTTDSGRKYYHNKITQVSTWDKPAELKSSVELEMAASTWKEYISDSGKKYYYNQVTKESVWEEPAEYRALLEAQEQELRRPIDNPTSPVAHVSPKSPTVTTPPQAFVPSTMKVNPTTQEEKVAVFKKLLEDAAVTSTWTWDMTMRAIANDERYKVLKTLSEKKQALSEYQVERRKAEREEKRKKDNKAKEAFVQMLKECEHLTPKMPWRKAVAYLEGDTRFEAIPERDREELYEEYLVDKERLEKEAARNARKDNMKKLRYMFEADPNININAQWRKVKEQFKDNETFKALEKIDRLTVFEDYIRDLEKEEETKKRDDLQAKRRQARKARDSFRALLNEKHQEGTLAIHTRWKDFLKLIRDDERYKAMIDPEQSGSLPSELFGDFQDSLEEKYYQEKKKLKEILKELELEITSASRADDIFAQLQKSPKFDTLNQQTAKYILNNWVKKTAEEQRKKEKEGEKKKRKETAKFVDLLYSSKKFSPASVWADVRQTIKDHPSFLSIATEEERIFIFEETKKRSQDESSDEEGRIRDYGKDKKKDRKKEKKLKHHRKHSRDDSDPEDITKRLRPTSDPMSVDHKEPREARPLPPPTNLPAPSAPAVPVRDGRESSPEEGEAR